MHEFWTTTNMIYTRQLNYTNIVIGEYGIQTFEVVLLLLLMLSFDVFVPQVHIP